MNAGLYTFANRPQTQTGIEQKLGQKGARGLLNQKGAKLAHFAIFCHISNETKSWIPVAVKMEKARCGNLDPLRPLDNAPALG